MRRVAMALGVFAGSCAVGCVASTDDGNKFREPLPVASEMSLSVPRSGASTARGGLAFGPGDTAPVYAKYYQFTRDVTDGVDLVTAVVLGSVWLVVHTHPTTIDDRHATWGPGAG